MNRDVRRHRWLAVALCLAVALVSIPAHTTIAAAAGRTAVPHSVPACSTGIDDVDSSPPVFSHIRPLDESLADSLRAGVRRSQTLASLVDLLETLDGIVYLAPGAVRRVSQGLVLRGGLSHQVTLASPYR